VGRDARWRQVAAAYELSKCNIFDVTPSGAHWVEPGNISPDGRFFTFNSDIGIADAEGQDQFVLNLNTGEVTNLTNSPQLWDEHGVFSPDGKKIVWMSSLPYPGNWHVSNLKTEFFLTNSDGSDIRQPTNFGNAIAASLIGPMMARSSMRFWCQIGYIIQFAGACGESAMSFCLTDSHQRIIASNRRKG
jgi:hypothetical protein